MSRGRQSLEASRLDRRWFLARLLALPVSGVVGGALYLGRGAAAFLRPSGPVLSRADGQIIENLDIYAPRGNGITILHQGVIVRSCRIRHAMGSGIYAQGAAGIRLQDLEIDHVGAPPSGAGPSQNRNNIELENCPNAIIILVKASRGSSNIYVVDCPGTQMKFLELHDARGPFPRGQNVQFNRSPDTSLEEFSAENGPTSWTEDNISAFHSDRCTIRRGLVFYNNSPTGVGIMLEGSLNCRVDDVDAVQQGNGAFSAVPQGKVESGGCSFDRCRSRDTYNEPRDGRDAPTSNGLSFHTRISEGAEKHSVKDCCVYALANADNIIWEATAVQAGWSIARKAFDPRPPLRLAFNW
ncbi:Hemolysin-type calcium-binding region [Mesorhizobium prunaredense]|uniref:Hemolysin-type calcium-binding region n=1 Tax=Mesorhizobium prunaredense TaxID=1631249 RepID=A0A1R3V0Y4_9HYPH|nr:right-handed parallel beta-helix repeat-containing protein [Mesorhizobium prunaredense]SIT53556.1 Hemolysin-type calcium-binding region [Mesorhizobium prunaredense]